VLSGLRVAAVTSVTAFALVLGGGMVLGGEPAAPPGSAPASASAAPVSTGEPRAGTPAPDRSTSGTTAPTPAPAPLVPLVRVSTVTTTGLPGSLPDDLQVWLVAPPDQKPDGPVQRVNGTVEPDGEVGFPTKTAVGWRICLNRPGAAVVGSRPAQQFTSIGKSSCSKPVPAPARGAAEIVVLTLVES
jgi:hypothetical protein